jgi:hypothetical protein
MKRNIIALPAAVILLSSVFCAMAQSNMPPPPPPCGGERPTLTDMTVTGKVTKAEIQMPDGNTGSCYILTDSVSNTVMLPGKHMGPGGEQASSVNLEEYVDNNVTIVGKGFQMERDGNKTTCLVVITKIDVVMTTSSTP